MSRSSSRHGDQTAVVVRVGGGLRTYDVAGRTVVDGFDVSARVDGGRGQVLAPWPNRVRDGRYRWADQDQQLALSEAANHNAIHGLVRWSEWSRGGADAVGCDAGDSRAGRSPGYPFLLDVTAAYVLDDGGLSVTLTGRNAGDVASPYGVGSTPMSPRAPNWSTTRCLTVPASAWVRTDERGLPVSTEPVDGTPWDFRAGRQVGDTVLDTPFTELHRDGGGPRRRTPRAGRRDATAWSVWGGAGADYLQVLLRGHPRAGPAPPRAGGRADVLPARRVQQRGGPGDPRAGAGAHPAVGTARLVRSAYIEACRDAWTSGEEMI